MALRTSGPAHGDDADAVLADHHPQGFVDHRAIRCCLLRLPLSSRNGSTAQVPASAHAVRPAPPRGAERDGTRARLRQPMDRNRIRSGRPSDAGLPGNPVRLPEPLRGLRGRLCGTRVAAFPTGRTTPRRRHVWLAVSGPTGTPGTRPPASRAYRPVRRGLPRRMLGTNRPEQDAPAAQHIAAARVTIRVHTACIAKSNPRPQNPPHWAEGRLRSNFAGRNARVALRGSGAPLRVPAPTR